MPYSRRARQGLEILSWETHGIAHGYDRILFETISDIRRSYREGRVWDMEHDILFLISTLPSSVKDRARNFFEEKYGKFKEEVREKLRRNLLPSFYEYKEELLSRLIEVYSYIIDLLDEAGISIYGRRDSIRLPSPSSPNNSRREPGQ